MSGNAKLKRVVHKLVLINRFNQTAARPNRNGPAKGSMASMMQSSGNAATMRTSTGSSTHMKSKWGRRSVIGKTLDNYIKESNNIYSYVETRRLVETDEQLPRGVLRPDLGPHLAWDLIILCLVVYYSFDVPIKLGFDRSSSILERIFDYVADCLFIVDIGVAFSTTFQVDGVWVTSRKQIVHQYLTTWFPVDLLSSFPIQWITDNISDTSGGGGSGVNKVLRMLRLFKLFRILRMLKLFPQLLTFLESSVKLDPAAVRFLRSFLLLLMMWHLIACAYWFLARWEYGGIVPCPEPFSDKWKCFVNVCLCDPVTGSDPAGRIILNSTNLRFYDPFNPDIWVPNPAIANSSLLAQYGTAIMFAVVVTTSIGANVVPRDALEAGFSVFIILVGLMMYSLVIGAASSALSNLDSNASAQKEVMEKITGYMRSRKVPTFFQKIIMDYYRHKWSNPGSLESASVLADLPSMLRSRLNVIINRDIIERFPVMQLMTMDSYLRMVARLKMSTYLPGEFIYKQGDQGDDIYFIKRGKVDMVLPNGVTVFLTLKPGNSFGEHSMLYLTKRDASVRAVDFVDVYMLHRSDFTELYVSAPEFIRELQRLDEAREKERLKYEVAFLRGSSKAGDATPITVRNLDAGNVSHTSSAASSSSNSINGGSRIQPVSPFVALRRLLGGDSRSSAAKGSMPVKVKPTVAAPSGSSEPSAGTRGPRRSSLLGGHRLSGSRGSTPSGVTAAAPTVHVVAEQPVTSATVSTSGLLSSQGASVGRPTVVTASPRPPAAEAGRGAAAAGEMGGRGALIRGYGSSAAGGGGGATKVPGITISSEPGKDGNGFDVEADFDLFQTQGAGAAAGKGGFARVVRKLMPSGKTKAEAEAAAKLAARAAAKAANPYKFKRKGEGSDDESDDGGEVLSIVAEQAHTPNLAQDEPSGRPRGDRRGSLRRPPSDVMRALARGLSQPEVDESPTSSPDRAGAAEMTTAVVEVTTSAPAPRSAPATPARPPQARQGSVAADEDGGTTPVRRQQQHAEAAAAAGPPGTVSPGHGVRRLPSGPLDVSDAALDDMLDQVGIL
jgi:CRP-like cAMP-binding protein